MSEIATDYMERALSLADRLRARQHLLLCPACRRYYAQLRRTIALLRESSPPEPPAGVEERVLSASRGDDPPGG